MKVIARQDAAGTPHSYQQMREAVGQHTRLAGAGPGHHDQRPLHCLGRAALVRVQRRENAAGSGRRKGGRSRRVGLRRGRGRRGRGCGPRPARYGRVEQQPAFGVAAQLRFLEQADHPVFAVIPGLANDGAAPQPRHGLGEQGVGACDILDRRLPQHG
ncbi:MAG: hypothetical protein WDN49_06805 [Acetobacteraceae bacterium]